MDWEKRREEIKYYKWITSENETDLDKIITQEQSMLAKAEEEKKELIEVLKSNWQMMEKYECKDCDIDCDWFQQGCEIRDTKYLLQKYSDKKEDSK